jgi:hypothetical protein
LRDIADVQDDIDAFITTFALASLQTCDVSAQIGRRLLKAGRAGEALIYLDASAADAVKGHPLWESVCADTLEALGQKQEAQAFLLACFERSLNADLLGPYIKRLPDFDDEEALDKALLYCAGFSRSHQSSVVPDGLACPQPRERSYHQICPEV